MKYALISSIENALDPNTQQVLGWRVAETAQQTFEVYKTLFWVECADEVAQDLWYYDTADKGIKEIPPYIPPPAPEQPTTSGTQEI